MITRSSASPPTPVYAWSKRLGAGTAAENTRPPVGRRGCPGPGTGIVGGVKEIVLRPAPTARRNLATVAVATGLVAVASAGYWVAGGKNEAGVLALCSAVIAVVAGWNYLGCRGSYVRIDAYGLDNRMLFHRRTLAWDDVAHIYVRRMISRGVPTDTIRVRPRRGLPFQLAAPMRGGVMTDPDFDAKLGEIESRWIAHGGRFIKRRRPFARHLKH